MSLSFSSKAGTLAALRGKVRSARIPLGVSFTLATWSAERSACLDEVSRVLGEMPWIVRSSCTLEDSMTASNAGAFLSIPDVNNDRLAGAIDEVFQSYGQINSDDEVLIQPMLNQVLRSGVAFSHDPNTCAPYRVVNWSDGTDTAAVTGGLGGRVWQQAALARQASVPAVAPVISLLDELQVLFGQVPVDCEFAFTQEDAEEVLWLLQARPLILSGPAETPDQQADRLEVIQ